MRLGKFPTFFPARRTGRAGGKRLGALHNHPQLQRRCRYYFHAIKFPQFAIPEGTPPRLGAAQGGVAGELVDGAAVGLPAFLYG